MERFMELYKSVYKDLYYLAYYYLGDPYDAEDALGETVLKAYENFAFLRKEEAFRAWIFTILVNQCKNLLKNRESRQTFELLEEPAYRPDLESQILVRELLFALSEEERQIVSLHIFGGYKSREIAEILQLSHSTVRSKYRRALKKLERRLSESEEMRHEK